MRFVGGIAEQTLRRCAGQNPALAVSRAPVPDRAVEKPRSWFAHHRDASQRKRIGMPRIGDGADSNSILAYGNPLVRMLLPQFSGMVMAGFPRIAGMRCERWHGRHRTTSGELLVSTRIVGFEQGQYLISIFEDLPARCRAPPLAYEELSNAC